MRDYPVFISGLPFGRSSAALQMPHNASQIHRRYHFPAEYIVHDPRRTIFQSQPENGTPSDLYLWSSSRMLHHITRSQRRSIRAGVSRPLGSMGWTGLDWMLTMPSSLIVEIIRLVLGSGRFNGCPKVQGSSAGGYLQHCLSYHIRPSLVSHGNKTLLWFGSISAPQFKTYCHSKFTISGTIF
jgi:hypothetical protein